MWSKIQHLAPPVRYRHHSLHLTSPSASRKTRIIISYHTFLVHSHYQSVCYISQKTFWHTLICAWYLTPLVRSADYSHYYMSSNASCHNYSTVSYVTPPVRSGHHSLRCILSWPPRHIWDTVTQHTSPVFSVISHTVIALRDRLVTPQSHCHSVSFLLVPVILHAVQSSQLSLVTSSTM